MSEKISLDSSVTISIIVLKIQSYRNLLDSIQFYTKNLPHK